MPDHDIDIDDVSDAFAFQTLTAIQRTEHLAHQDIEQDPPDDGDEGPSAAAHVRLEAGATQSPSRSALVVDRFPFGQPSAPIPGTSQGLSTYELNRGMLGGTIWAPFQSQNEWELARWGKMRGPTSSALQELLEIPEVWAHLSLITTSLTLCDRSLIGLTFRLAQQRSWMKSSTAYLDAQPSSAKKLSSEVNALNFTIGTSYNVSGHSLAILNLHKT